MDFTIPTNLKVSSKVFLQKAGYHEFIDPNTGATSFVRRLGNEFYPRFHIYVQAQEPMSLSLHIDQKHVSYEGAAHAHAGEYEGPLVEDEKKRLLAFAASGVPDRQSIMGVHDVPPPPGQDQGGRKSMHDKLGLS